MLVSRRGYGGAWYSTYQGIVCAEQGAALAVDGRGGVFVLIAAGLFLSTERYESCFVFRASPPQGMRAVFVFISFVRLSTARYESRRANDSDLLVVHGVSTSQEGNQRESKQPLDIHT